MDPDSRLSILFIILLFIASAYFALTETAIASVSRTKMKVASDRGDSRAKRVLYVLDHFDDAITTLLILTNIAHIAAAALITVLVTRKWGLSAVTLSTVLTTLLMFFVGEMLPKSIGKKASEQSCLSCSGLLVLLMKICYPMARLLTAIGAFSARLFKGEEEFSVTEDEIYDIIEDMAEEGSLDEDQGELISSALQFADVNVSSILTPRVDVSALDVNESPEAVLEFIRSQNHSRILVYEKTIDNVIGVLQIRKYLKAYVAEHVLPDVRSMLDTVYYAHQNMPIDDLLTEMSKNKLNMAVILDSYGGTLGIVTVEDILEEIVGEIWDEDDVIKEPIVELAKNRFLASGDETVLDTFDFVEYEDPDPENEDRYTNLLLSDWVIEQLENIPEKGDSFSYGPLTVTVNEIAHNRILKVMIVKSEETHEEVAE